MTPIPPFEPKHLITLLHAQYPQRTDILRALQLCPQGHWANSAYLQFIASRQSDLPTERHVVESLVLEDEHQGKIIVDIVEDGRIAGIAFGPRLINQ